VPLIALLIASAGCNSTKLNTSWKNPSASPIEFRKVVVVVLNSSPGERRAQEDVLVSQIKKATAVPSYTLVPDSDLANRDLVKQRIIDSGADGAAVVRLIETRREEAYIPGTSSYWAAGAGYSPYVYSPGRTVSNTIVRAEVSLYSVPDGKLLWAGESSTANPENPKDFATQVARAAADELRKQGMLR
jgi:hypothetical protein